jgi:hypothetical protein
MLEVPLPPRLRCVLQVHAQIVTNMHRRNKKLQICTRKQMSQICTRGSKRLPAYRSTFSLVFDHCSSLTLASTVKSAARGLPENLARMRHTAAAQTPIESRTHHGRVSLRKLSG